jgi:hypothetical protein
VKQSSPIFAPVQSSYGARPLDAFSEGKIGASLCRADRDRTAFLLPGNRSDAY